MSYSECRNEVVREDAKPVRFVQENRDGHTVGYTVGYTYEQVNTTQYRILLFLKAAFFVKNPSL